LEKKTFDKTRAAIKVFDESEPQRIDMFALAYDGIAVKAWVKAELDAIDAVRRAFFEDTKDINSLERCMIADIEYMRMCVESVTKYAEAVSAA